jgi:hypothetical protein
LQAEISIFKEGKSFEFPLVTDFESARITKTRVKESQRVLLLSGTALIFALLYGSLQATNDLIFTTESHSE